MSKVGQTDPQHITQGAQDTIGRTKTEEAV